MQIVDAGPLRDIAELEFSDVVLEVLIPDVNELRIFLRDGSFVDVWFSLRLAGRYSYLGSRAPTGASGHRWHHLSP